jgi:hypothetical protein
MILAKHSLSVPMQTAKSCPTGHDKPKIIKKTVRVVDTSHACCTGVTDTGNECNANIVDTDEKVLYFLHMPVSFKHDQCQIIGSFQWP